MAFRARTMPRTAPRPEIAPASAAPRFPRRRSAVSSLPALLLAALVLLAVPHPAAAHDFWIQPGDFTPALGRPVGVELRVGVSFPGGQVARRDAHTLRFASLGPSGETALPGVDGAAPAGLFQPTTAGDHVFVFRGDDSPISLPAAEFEAYLAEEGLEAVSASRAERGETEEPGRELFSRSVKALVTVSPGTASSGTVSPGTASPDTASPASAATASPDAATPTAHLRPAGLDLELVPEARPRDLAVGDELTLRLLFHGEPLAGLKVRAEPAAAGGSAQAVRSGEDGRVTFHLDSAGEWKIATVHMQRVPDDDPRADEAEWRSTWTSLTFELGSD